MDTATTEEKFHHATELIRNLPKSGSYQPSNDLKLKFYSYFKQATEGPCDSAKPGFWDIINRAKWEAWNGLGEMSKEEAMQRYVDEFVQILMSAPFDEKANDYVHLMGPFFYLAPKEFREKHSKLNGDVKNNCDTSHKPNEILENNNLQVTKVVKGMNTDFSNESSEDSRQLNGHNVNGTTESDSEEFSDTFDQVNGGESENDVRVSSKVAHRDDIVGEDVYNSAVHSSKGSNVTQMRGGGDQRIVAGDTNSPISGGSGNRGNRNHRRGRAADFPFHHRPSNNSADGGGGGGGRRHDDNRLAEPSSDVAEQLAFAVIRLQHTMEQVVSRLDSLEALLQEKKSNSCLKVSTVKNSFWAIFGIPPRAALLIFAWPFIAQWLIYIMQKRRRRL